MSPHPSPEDASATAARLQAGDDRMTALETSLSSLREMVEAAAEANAASLQQLSRQMQANTEVTQSIKDIVDTGKALFKLGGWIGGFVRWATPVAVALVAVWAFMSGKKLP